MSQATMDRDAASDGVAREQGRVMEENARAQSASTTHKWVTGMLAVLLLGSIGLNGAFLHAYVYTFPLKKWVWTRDARAVCDATPLSYPSVSAARIQDFAAGAAVELNSFDYLNNGRVLNAAVVKYMTPAGRVSFLDSLQDSGIVQTVEKNYIVLETVPIGPPYIKQEGVRAQDKRYFWEVQVPVRMFYYVLGDRKPEDRVVTVTVVRVDPSPEHQNGIAVDGFRSTQMTTQHIPDY